MLKFMFGLLLLRLFGVRLQFTNHTMIEIWSDHVQSQSFTIAIAIEIIDTVIIVYKVVFRLLCLQGFSAFAFVTDSMHSFSMGQINPNPSHW
jgi:hypothetical protein